MKDRNEIYQMLSEILVTMFEIDENEISLDSHLYEDMDLDSIDAVDLVVKLREYTGKKINPEDFKLVRTVKDVVDAVEKLTVK